MLLEAVAFAARTERGPYGLGVSSMAYLRLLFGLSILLSLLCACSVSETPGTAAAPPAEEEGGAAGNAAGTSQSEEAKPGGIGAERAPSPAAAGASEGKSTPGPTAEAAGRPASLEGTEPPREPAPPAASGGAESSETSQSASPGTAGAATPCDALLGRLRTLRAGIPIVFSDLKRSPDEIDRDILQAIPLAEKFIAECSEHPELAWVKAFLARDLLSRYRRAVEAFRKEGLRPEELEEEATRYKERIRRLAEEALAASKPGTEGREAALAILADAALYQGDLTSQRRYIDRLLEEFPRTALRSKFLQDYGRSLFLDGKYEEAAAYLRKVIAENREDPNYILYASTLVDALHGMGDLEGLEDLCIQLRKECLERMKRTESAFLRSAYETWYHISLFHAAFARYAMGEVEGAASLLREFKSDFEKLEAEGKKIPNVVRIYHDFRVKELLGVFENLQGKVPETDFDQGVDWVTGNTLTLKDARGKVVVILARPPKNERTLSLLLELDSLARKNANVEAVVLTFYGSRHPERRAARREAFLEELKTLGVGLPAGIDATDNHKIFHALNLTVGTPSLVVIDTEGRYAWFRADPRDMDRALVRRIVARLLGAKK